MSVVSQGLVIFDVDGTLVDSQFEIVTAMRAAFAAVERPPPDRARVLRVVGLSLPHAMTCLASDANPATLERMVEAYRDSYADLRRRASSTAAPLYPGMLALLDHLDADGDIVLGIATGKSRRGLDALLDSLDLRHYFATVQCADDHPGKPHPSMMLSALSETGMPAHRAVMVGDTVFDIDMAIAARVASIGVTWGYHRRSDLERATMVVDEVESLAEAIPMALQGTP